MLNNFLKHGIIVGIVTLLISAMVIVAEISVIRYIIAAPDDYDLSLTFIGKHVGVLCSGLLSIIFSLLLIWGMAKKRHLLLVPWLVFHFLAYVFITFSVFYELISRDFRSLDDFMFCVTILGFGIIVIYPIYILYIELHSLNMLDFARSGIKY